MKKIIVLLIVSFFSFACKKEIKKKTSNSETLEITPKKETVDEHSSKLSLDWNGYYYGVLLSNKNEKIKTFIVLNNDNTYEKFTEIIGLDKIPTIEEGTFSWSDDGNNILFNNEPNTSLKILESGLLLLNGGKTTKYVLEKTDGEALSKNFKGLTLQHFKSGNQKFNIFYNTNENKPTALITSDFFCEKLVQTSAWAKGAEYESGDYKLVAKGDNVSLFIKGKEVKLK